MKKKPKIVRVVTDGRVVLWHLEKTLRDLKDDFEVVVVGENVSKFTPPELGVRCYDIPLTPKINLYKDISALYQLARILVRERPVIVHSIMPKAGLITAFASRLIVPYRFHTFTGQVWQTKTGFGKWALKVLDKVVVFLNTKCLTDSRSQSEYLHGETISDRSGGCIEYLCCGSLGGVDLKKIDIEKKDAWSIEIREEYSIPKANIVIGYLARKTADKGAFLFLELCREIVKEYSNVSFMFVGPDDSGGAVTDFLNANEDLKNRIVCVDTVSNHEKYLASFDILCLPSFREGFGSIVIDAAALGIPTVGSRIPGLVDAVVDGETGILINLSSVSELVFAIRKLVGEPALLSKLGENARMRVVNSFDSKVLSECLIEFYNDFINVGKWVKKSDGSTKKVGMSAEE